MTTLDYLPGRRGEARARQVKQRQDSGAERIFDLIAQYPHISGAEAAEVMRFVRNARYTEVARLASDDRLRNQLDQIVRNHKHEIQWSAIDWIAPIAIGVGILASVWVLWPFMA